MNYTLEINGTQNDEIRVSVFAPNAENFTIGDNLSENVAYSFRIQVANTVGVVSTSDRQFCKILLFNVLQTPFFLLQTPLMCKL